MFSSSRTFPGYEYDRSLSSASSLISGRVTPMCRATRSSKHIHQQRHVVEPLAQGRHSQLDHVDAVVEVLAEPARLDQFVELAVSRRKYAHVDRGLAGFSHRPDRFFLDHAQQLHLHVQRQVRDLVQEQRAALGRADQPFLVRDRTGEAAFLVPEKLALHQLRWNRTAIDRDEWPVAARPGFVNQARDQFLARARVAGDVHRAPGCGRLWRSSAAVAASDCESPSRRSAGAASRSPR